MQHGELAGQKVAAQIYVHSKVMINDTSAIVGSGNINERRFVLSSPLFLFIPFFHSLNSNILLQPERGR